MKIFQYFQGKVITNAEVDEYHCMARNEPHVSVGGLLALGKDRQNSVRIMLENVKNLVTGRKRSYDRSREGRTEENKGRTKADKEERVKA